MPIACCRQANVIGCSWALLRQEGMNGRVLGMLASLDGIRFLLPVDPFHDGLDPSQQPGIHTHMHECLHALFFGIAVPL